MPLGDIAGPLAKGRITVSFYGSLSASEKGVGRDSYFLGGRGFRRNADTALFTLHIRKIPLR